MSYAGKPLPPYASYAPVAAPRETSNPLGTISLVLGILSVFMGCPFAIGALIVGWAGMKREPSGVARAGFMIGLVMTILNTAVLMIGVLCFVVFGGMIGLAAYLDSQDSGDQAYPSYAESSYPPVEMPSPYMGGEPYAIPEMPAVPMSMPAPTIPMPEMPDPHIPAPYSPPSYVPPPMPGVDTSPFPQPPTGFYPPGAYPPGAFPPGAFPPGMGPPGAFPPGLGPPVSVEPTTDP